MPAGNGTYSVMSKNFKESKWHTGTGTFICKDTDYFEYSSALFALKIGHYFKTLVWPKVVSNIQFLFQIVITWGQENHSFIWPGYTKVFKKASSISKYGYCIVSWKLENPHHFIKIAPLSRSTSTLDHRERGREYSKQKARIVAIHANEAAFTCILVQFLR